MLTTTIARPAADEYAPYYGRYIDLVQGDDGVSALASQITDTAELLGRVDEQRATHRYAPGKWSVKQVVGHLADAERVFSYRALRFARADETPLPGFDENTYAERGDFDRRPLRELVLELRAVRAASIALFGALAPDAALRRGTANNTPMSVRALVWTIAGHELHHRRVLKERYGLK
jgi:uncharacterized damage-inducible protein DinB